MYVVTGQTPSKKGIARVQTLHRATCTHTHAHILHMHTQVEGVYNWLNGCWTLPMSAAWLGSVLSS